MTFILVILHFSKHQYNYFLSARILNTKNNKYFLPLIDESDVFPVGGPVLIFHNLQLNLHIKKLNL